MAFPVNLNANYYDANYAAYASSPGGAGPFSSATRTISLISIPAGVAAFTTTTGLAVVTVGAAVSAASATATLAIVAYSIMAIAAGALSLASITAWMSPTSTDTQKYFNNLIGHAAYAIPAMAQFVAQVAVQALVQGLANGISRGISRKVGGSDITLRYA